MGLHLFSALPFPVTCLGDRWRVSVGRWIEQVEVDVFMIACWASDVFKWLCGCDGLREQWRRSPVNFARGARWMAAVNKDHAVFCFFFLLPTTYFPWQEQRKTSKYIYIKTDGKWICSDSLWTQCEKQLQRDCTIKCGSSIKTCGSIRDVTVLSISRWCCVKRFSADDCFKL